MSYTKNYARYAVLRSAVWLLDAALAKNQCIYPVPQINVENKRKGL